MTFKWGGKWHSINVVPFMSAMSICADEEPYEIVSRDYDFVFLGRVFRISVPSKSTSKQWSTPILGPLWSRGRRVWYTR
jgi:hypothetical protein